MAMISVIVPIYNAEKHLRPCIDSLLCQTYPDFELILINDGSSDSSGDLCERYAQIDDRIRVAHQPNAGVSAARNKGLSLSSAPFIAFCDSDDFVTPDYLKTLMQSEADLVISGIKTLSTSNETIVYSKTAQKIACCAIDTDLVAALLEMNALNFVVGKRFALSNIQKHQLQFDERLKLGEDTLFVSSYLVQSATIEFFPNCDYRYRIMEHSLSSSFVPDNFMNIMQVNHAVETQLCDTFENSAIKSKMAVRYWDICERNILKCLSSDLSRSEKNKLIQMVFHCSKYKTLSKNIDLYLKNKNKMIKILFKIKSPFLLILATELKCKMQKGASSCPM